MLRNTEFATVDERRECPKKNYKNITTKFKLNLGVEVKSPWMFLIFMNFFLRRTSCLIRCVGLFNRLLPLEGSHLEEKKCHQLQYFNRPFSAATKTFVLGNLFKLCKICHHIRTGSSLLGIMKRIGRICHIFLHLYPQTAIKFL